MLTTEPMVHAEPSIILLNPPFFNNPGCPVVVIEEIGIFIAAELNLLSFFEDEAVYVAFAFDFKFCSDCIHIDVSKQVNKHLAEDYNAHLDCEFFECAVALDNRKSRLQKHNIYDNGIINILKNICKIYYYQRQRCTFPCAFQHEGGVFENICLLLLLFSFFIISSKIRKYKILLHDIPNVKKLLMFNIYKIKILTQI